METLIYERDIKIELNENGNPLDFFDKIEDRVPLFETVPLKAENQLEKYKGVRDINGEIEAIPVSKKFQLVQHKDVITAVKQLELPEIERGRFQTFREKTGMFLDLIFNREIKIDDTELILGGLRVLNSVAGSMRLAIFPYTFRINCFNEMGHTTEKVGFKHIGERPLLDLFKTALTKVLEVYPRIEKIYNEWKNLSVVITEPIYKKITKILPKKDLEGLIVMDYAVNGWELFNNLTRLNTHDSKRNALTKANYFQKIEQVMSLL